MIFIMFLGCASSPKDIKNETIENKSVEYIKNETGDSMAKVKEEVPEEVWIKEYESANIFDTWNVTVKGIFMHSGKIKAELDISAGFDDLLKDTPSMPLYLGHRIGEEVIVGHGNDYYLKEIKKFGKDKSGYVIISKEKPTEMDANCKDGITIEETTVGKLGGVSAGVGNLGEIDGKISGQISLWSREENKNYGNFILYEGDTLWAGECAYKVERIFMEKNENGYVALKFVGVTDMVDKQGKEPEGKKTTVKGIANRVKVGLEVDGVFLEGLSPNQIDKYAEKYVEITGYVTEAPELVVEPYEKGKPISQGFQSAPNVMRNVVSIKIIKK